MKLHGGPNLARGPEFDTHALNNELYVCFCIFMNSHDMKTRLSNRAE